MAVIFAALGLVFVLCQWLFPLEPNSIHVISWFHDLRQRWIKQKADIIISYNLSDYRWASWIKCELEGQGYLVGLQDCKEYDFKEKIREATKHAECVLTVLSPDYFDPLHVNSERFKLFKKLNRLGGKGILVQVGKCNQNEKLGKLTLIDLVGLNDKDALDKLIGSMRYRLGKHQVASAQTVAQSGCKPFPGDIPRNWNVPLLSPFFTGREKELGELHQKFEKGGAEESIKQLTISGLAGMGMTEVAVKFAYLYYKGYRDVLWLSMSPKEKHSEDLERIVDQLGLTAQNLQSSDKGIIEWLESKDNWLLILDHCDNPNSQEVRAFIPRKGRGHILLTTDMGTTDAAHTVRIVQWKPDEGALFLLRRSGTINPDDPIEKACETDRNIAMEISHEIGHVPFALNFAGVFIYQTKESLPNYLKLYKDRRPDLKSRFKNADDKTITWLLSFEKVKRAAAALLLFCAFLDPDEISLELIQRATSGPITTDRSTLKTELEWLNVIANDELELMDAVIELTQFCLIERNRQTKTLTTHRLMQDTLKDELTEDDQRNWAERAIVAVNSVFPDVEFPNWDLCQRYLPHAQACANHIQQLNLESQEAIRLLYVTGRYLQELARYKDAQEILERVKTYRKKLPGADADLAACLNTLGTLYQTQGKYKEARILYEKAKALCEQNKGQNDPYLATILNNLGRLFYEWGIYANARVEFYQNAQDFYKEALRIRKSIYGSESHEVAICLNNIGLAHIRQGNFEEAKANLLNALNMCDRLLGNKHLDTALCGISLAEFYANRGEYQVNLGTRVVNVEEYYKGALLITIPLLGPDHPQVAARYCDLAELYQKQKFYSLAKENYLKALAIYEEKLGSEHPQVAVIKHNYATLLLKMDYGKDKVQKRQKHNKARDLEREARTALAKHNQEDPLP